MKIYTASIKHEDYTTEYIVKAETKEEAEKKVKAICGEKLKVKEK